MNNTEKEIHWDDIGYSVEYIPGDYHINFRSFKISGRNQDDRRVFNKKDECMDFTTNTSAAEVFLSGHIKWDGCSNMRFDAQDDCMLHFCGRDDAIMVGELMSRLYELAKNNIKQWQDI